MSRIRALLGGATLASLAGCLAPAPDRAVPGGVPVGTVVAYTGERVPHGWLLCDGRPLRRGDWPELFHVIGTSHGSGVSPLGVQEGAFNLPDYRGRFLRGVDMGEDGSEAGADPEAGTRSAARAGTGNSGDRVGSYQPSGTALPRDPMQPFRSVLELAAPGQAGLASPAGRGEEASGTVVVPAPAATVHRYPVTGGDVETRPTNVSVRWIIRAQP